MAVGLIDRRECSARSRPAWRLRRCIPHRGRPIADRTRSFVAFFALGLTLFPLLNVVAWLLG
jgi:hypothetical protein